MSSAIKKESFMNDDDREGTKMLFTFEGLNTSVEGQIILEPMEILSWSFGALNGASKCFGDLKMTKYASSQSPHLFKHLSEHSIFRSATLVSSNKRQVMQIKLYDATVVQVSTGGSGGEGRLTENFVISYGKMEYLFEDKSGGKKTTTTSGRLTAK
jgi:type VI secretion system secreted protein Hcp